MRSWRSSGRWQRPRTRSPPRAKRSAWNTCEFPTSWSTPSLAAAAAASSAAAASASPRWSAPRRRRSRCRRCGTSCRARSTPCGWRWIAPARASLMRELHRLDGKHAVVVAAPTASGSAFNTAGGPPIGLGGGGDDGSNSMATMQEAFHLSDPAAAPAGTTAKVVVSAVVAAAAAGVYPTSPRFQGALREVLRHCSDIEDGTTPVQFMSSQGVLNAQACATDLDKMVGPDNAVVLLPLATLYLVRVSSGPTHLDEAEAVCRRAVALARWTAALMPFDQAIFRYMAALFVLQMTPQQPQAPSPPSGARLERQRQRGGCFAAAVTLRRKILTAEGKVCETLAMVEALSTLERRLGGDDFFVLMALSTLRRLFAVAYTELFNVVRRMFQQAQDMADSMAKSAAAAVAGGGQGGGHSGGGGDVPSFLRNPVGHGPSRDRQGLNAHGCLAVPPSGGRREPGGDVTVRLQRVDHDARRGDWRWRAGKWQRREKLRRWCRDGRWHGGGNAYTHGGGNGEVGAPAPGGDEDAPADSGCPSYAR
ncbi:unnamed protein product [Phaeothamnion confervicola]